jgi:tight adherence protein B
VVVRSQQPVAPDFDVVAAVVHRLAVLLTAGIGPDSAWRHAASGSPSPVVVAVAGHAAVGHAGARRVAVGRDFAAQLRAAAEIAPPAERTAWAALSAAWWVAIEVGAPLGPTLQRFADSLRALAESLGEVEVALAGPLATSRIVLALPGVGLLVGMLLGVDATRILFTTPAGWGCLVLGGALIAGGVRWNRSLIRRARELDPAPGLALELLAIAASGGASLERAQQLVNEALDAAGLSPLSGGADAVLDFARAAGVPAAGLLRAEAEESRRRSRSEGRRRAAELGSRLLLPLGLCILPAFIALGVVPIVIAILSSTLSAV